MEPEGSLPHPEVPATCPYPEPARSSPIPTSHFLKTHLIIILPSVPGSPKCSLSLTFPHQNPICAFPVPHTPYMHSPSHSSRFYHTKNIGWVVQIIEFLIMKCSPLPCYIVPLKPKYPPRHSVLKDSQLTLIRQCEHQVSHPYKTTGKTIILYILIFTVLTTNWKFHSRLISNLAKHKVPE